MTTSINVLIYVEGREHHGKIEICGDAIQQIVDEILSSLNRFGTQCAYGVHDPTPKQLVKQYVDTGIK